MMSRRYTYLAIGRTSLLLKRYFFQSSPYCDEFVRLTGLTIDDWILCGAVFIAHQCYSPERKSALHTLIHAYEINPAHLLSQADQSEKLERYLKLVSQSPEQLRHEFLAATQRGTHDLGPLRRQPILRISESRYIAVDQRMFIENFAVGPLFLLAGHLRSQQPFDVYGLACEAYAYEIIERINLQTSEGFRAPFLVKEPMGNSNRPLNDITIGDRSALALIEIKGVWLNDKLLLEREPEYFWQAIKKKYGQTVSENSDGDIVRKGVAQLADSVLDIASGALAKNGVTPDFIISCQEIFPVLLVQDSMMVQGYFPHQLALDFVELIGGDTISDTGYFQLGKLKIHNLICWSLFDIENLQSRDLSNCSILTLMREFSSAVTKRGDTFSAFLRHEHKDLAYLPSDSQFVRHAAIEALSAVAASLSQVPMIEQQV